MPEKSNLVSAERLCSTGSSGFFFPPVRSTSGFRGRELFSPPACFWLPAFQVAALLVDGRRRVVL